MGDFDSYMLKEIYEQSFSLERCMEDHLVTTSGGGGGIQFKELDGIEDQLNAARKLTFIACGTSWHSCLMAKYYIESKARIEVEVDYASEYIYRNPIINKGDIVCAISQSGETADTISAIELAKSKGAIILSLVNTMESTIDSLSDHSIDLKIGTEISVASTKAFTGQVLVGMMLALYLGSNNGKISKVELEENIKHLKELPSLVSRTLRLCVEDIQNQMFNFHETTSAIYLGRGLCFPIALEGALKLKEISYIHAEGYPAAEMKHGPIALIDESMPVVFIVHGQDPIYEKIVSNIEEVRSRNGRLIIITNESNDSLNHLSSTIFKVPDCSMDIFPFLSVVITQIISYYLAKYRKCNIDKPRNLAKCVTVE
jgi:glucosamine--fructose-6-phosphate aminotransferase (isomerizing)